MSQVLPRPLLSNIHPNHRRFPNFCSLQNGETFENASTPSSSSSPVEKSPENGYVCSYLVKACGLSPSKALSASKKVSFDRPDKPNAVVNVLENQGFSKAQLSELVSRYPLALVSKTLPAKIDFLLRFFSSMPEEDVLTAVSRYPHLLQVGLEHRLVPMYEYLKGVIGDEKLETLFRRGSWCFSMDFQSRVIPNVNFLRGLGVPESNIVYALFNCPDILNPRHDEFRKTVEEVKGMGFDVMKSTFVLAINARTGKGNLGVWDRCYEVYSKWGWSEEDISRAYRKHPNCMLMSEKKISGVLGFLVEELGREPRSVVTCPNIFFYNMKKRIVPRCSVVHLLASKGLFKKDWHFTTVLCPAEKVFIDKFVTRYAEEFPKVYDFYLSKKTRIVEA